MWIIKKDGLQECGITELYRKKKKNGEKKHIAVKEKNDMWEGVVCKRKS